MVLPEDFIRNTRAMMGDRRFDRYMAAFDEPVPVSIRLNPQKSRHMTVDGGEPVGWCPEGYYLDRRPAFTFDPLLHAGAYYVQEAASMFVSHVLRQYVDRPVSVLDLCAAPGGKSTATIASLPEGSTLCANEPDRRRCSILEENIAKWGYAGCTVTNRYPRDFRCEGCRYDVVICDVPCSGEGMFRRDAATIGEWSLQNVGKCWRLQRDIVGDAWQCLAPGGLMVYSTCTFNTLENEENILWMLRTFDDARVLPVDTLAEWHITGSLLDGFREPVYRFFPGVTRSEGLFVCVLRKEGFSRSEERVTSLLAPPSSLLENTTVPLDYAQALRYLRGESLTLPADAPLGVVTVSFEGFPLGTVKNIGSRANNQYPKPWRIKTTHIPTDYEAILRHT